MRARHPKNWRPIACGTKLKPRGRCDAMEAYLGFKYKTQQCPMSFNCGLSFGVTAPKWPARKNNEIRAETSPSVPSTGKDASRSSGRTRRGFLNTKAMVKLPVGNES